MDELFKDESYMRQALQQAQLAYDIDEVPVGAIVVCKDRIVAKSHNLTESLKDVTAHAEILAITAASNYLGAKYLKDCTLYITLEPCLMCAGALSWSQIGRIVIGAADSKHGYELHSQRVLHPKTIVQKGVLAKESEQLLKSFFNKKRK